MQRLHGLLVERFDHNNRIVGRVTASDMASASPASVMPRFTWASHRLLDQLDPMTKCHQLPCAMKRRGAGLHANQPRRLFLEERQNLRASQLAADKHCSLGIDAMELKNVLRKASTNCDNFAHRRLLLPCGSYKPTIWQNVIPSGGSRPLHQKQSSEQHG